MSDSTQKPAIDEAALRDHIEDILRRIEEEEDPQELNEYRRLFKKYVPLFRRGYFAGYIMKYGAIQDAGNSGRSRPRRARKDELRKEEKRRARSQQAVQESSAELDQPYADNGNDETESGLTSVFVGVGKNRRVYPKDLIQLFSELDNIETSDIGQIKILDNYSFVEVNPEKAQAAIEQLNGSEYRGRKVTVNFARRKD